ncbi:MAG: hypothetical protein JWN32_3121, partial [Solirubrobacterales bacterium]|nr:hypothetical protein [Solirubrobacterales bacterium]
YRVLSLDYAKGTAGLSDVERQVRAALATHPTQGPLCLYGESAGAHLALLAARDIGRVDCVVAAGTPADFETWPAEAEAQGLAGSLGVFLSTVVPTFGPPGPRNLIWQPAAQARRIRADVLLVRQADDLVVPARQTADYRAADPTAREWVAAAAPADSAPIPWMHGTLSSPAAAELPRVLRRAVEAAGRTRAQLRAAHLPACRAATTSVLTMTPAAVDRAVGCLAGARGPRRARLVLRGHPTPARIAASLLRAGSRRGRRHPWRYAVRIHLGAASRVVVTGRAGGLVS